MAKGSWGGTGCELWFIEDFDKQKGRKESPQQKQPFWPGPDSGQGGVELMGDQLLVGGGGTCPGVHTPICVDRGGLAKSEKPYLSNTHVRPGATPD